ncbi:MAG TPA: pilus assembly PilX N-terminal domain-containing protein [Candidatus Paceibacterota bacterium]
MAITNKKRGIALLVTLIFMSVMLAFGLTLASLAYKQAVLASNATKSQQAFFAADGALECALYADQQQGAYNYADYSASDPPDASIAEYAADACDGAVIGTPVTSWTAGRLGRLTVSERISFNNGTSCADVVIYKYGQLIPSPPGPEGKQWKAFIYSTGYSVACSAIASASAGGRIVVRGLFLRF